MSCRVYDKLFKNFAGSLIGVFSIPIGKIKKEQHNKYHEHIEKLDKIIEELKKAFNDEQVLDYVS